LQVLRPSVQQPDNVHAARRHRKEERRPPETIRPTRIRPRVKKKPQARDSLEERADRQQRRLARQKRRKKEIDEAKKWFRVSSSAKTAAAKESTSSCRIASMIVLLFSLKGDHPEPSIPE
jgi:hypothetical protein